MLLVDSNVFIYARSRHSFSKSCRKLLAAGSGHAEWAVPALVLLEVTHYYGDGGAYARLILGAFSVVETLVYDLEWAFHRCKRHADLNDHILLASADRLGASGVISYDRFFDDQVHLPHLCRVDPADLI